MDEWKLTLGGIRGGSVTVSSDSYIVRSGQAYSHRSNGIEDDKLGAAENGRNDGRHETQRTPDV